MSSRGRSGVTLLFSSSVAVQLDDVSLTNEVADGAEGRRRCWVLQTHQGSRRSGGAATAGCVADIVGAQMLRRVADTTKSQTLRRVADAPKSQTLQGRRHSGAQLLRGAGRS